MKKVWLILGVVVSLVALGMGMTSAYAQDDGNSGSLRGVFCDEWLLGEIQGDPTGNMINLVPRGGETPEVITVDEDTNYKAGLAPWQEVTFESLDDGDWVAVCIMDGVARVVILLEAPQKPFHLRLAGNVTGVVGQEITVNIGEDNTFTVDLSNSGADTTGIEEGQYVSLTISECKPLLGLKLRGVLQRIKPRIENWQGQGILERIKPRIENWQGQELLERFKQRFENWQGWGMLERFKQRFENWQD